MLIKFIESHSFVGEQMSMKVDDEIYYLKMNKNQTYQQHAIKILKEDYDIDFLITDIKFEWDGTL